MSEYFDEGDLEEIPPVQASGRELLVQFKRTCDENEELKKQVKGLAEALRPFVRLWPNTVSTISLHIAEERLAKVPE